MIRKDFFYDDITKPVTDQIFEMFKSGCKSFEGYAPWTYDIPILDDSRFINWTFGVARVPNLTRVDIWASAGADECAEPSLDFTIVLKKGQHQKKAHIDYAELFGVVAHELHHIAQNTEKVGHHFPVPVCRSKKMSYFIDPIEVEAFNLGFRAQSSISGIPVVDIMSEYLSLQLLDSDEKEYVMKLWLETDYPVLRKNLEEK